MEEDSVLDIRGGYREPPAQRSMGWILSAGRDPVLDTLRRSEFWRSATDPELRSDKRRRRVLFYSRGDVKVLLQISELHQVIVDDTNAKLFGLSDEQVKDWRTAVEASLRQSVSRP